MTVGALLSMDTARCRTVFAEEHLNVYVSAHQPIILEHRTAESRQQQLEQITIVRGQLTRVEQNRGSRAELLLQPAQPLIRRLGAIRSRRSGHGRRALRRPR